MDWKKIGNSLLFPPLWLMLILTVISAVLLTMVFVKGWEQAVIAYFVYVLAFYTLIAVSAFCVMVLPKQMQGIREKIYSNPVGSRYMTDPVFRTRLSMYTSLGINLLFVAVNLLLWYLANSWWYTVLAAYYSILSLLWALLAGYVRKHAPGTAVGREWKRSRICAFILLSINLALSGAVLMILYQNKGFHYNGILIYVMALFTFYSAVTAVVNMVKYRKLESPVMSTSRTVSLSAALVSMLNLETAMFAQFGAELSQEHQRIFIVLTGAGVSIIIVTLSVILIVRATKEIRSEKYGK